MTFTLHECKYVHVCKEKAELGADGKHFRPPILLALDSFIHVLFLNSTICQR